MNKDFQFNIGVRENEHGRKERVVAATIQPIDIKTWLSNAE